jgi:extradiol dioxygenase family protein
MDRTHIFHLAIPCRALDETAAFYEKLGAREARRMDDRVTFDFFGDQIVCHLAPDRIDPDPQMYPRHFGLTFRKREDYEACLARARAQKLPFFREPFVRFEGRRDEHAAFFLRDPSNNVLEFKHYNDPAMMF